MAEQPTQLLDRLAAKRRREKATDDGRCATCGRYRAACRPNGIECIYKGDGLDE